jgi:uncharacterized 2Fe-2S/4Fe-4S cluster protein (DUF4445 family)
MESDDNLKKIRSILIKELNRMIRELCNKSQVSPEEIDEAVVVGNTAMHHLFLGLPVTQLARVPFVPALRQAFDIKARDAGINIAAGAYIHLLPNIAGFVGADHVAMIMATGIRQYEGVTLAVDVGTNTEICLVADGKTTSVSCASGPAFEGGHIKDGMRAARGAIERLYIQNSNVFYHTVGNAKPAGICGSGIIDTLGQLVLNNVVDESGRMDTDYPNVRSEDGQREFIIVDEKERRGAPAISITQHDIRELQMAKAAIQVGIQTLLKNSDHTAEEIDNVVIAGAFGSYIDVANAIAIGMLPSLPINRFEQVGNAAGMGAKLALFSLQKRAEAQAIAYSTEYIELATTQDFMQNFVDATYLKPYT